MRLTIAQAAGYLPPLKPVKLPEKTVDLVPRSVYIRMCHPRGLSARFGKVRPSVFSRINLNELRLSELMKRCVPGEPPQTGKISLVDCQIVTRKNRSDASHLLKQRIQGF
jgi:hypothetical protein